MVDIELDAPRLRERRPMARPHPLLDEHLQELYAWAHDVAMGQGADTDLAWQIAGNLMVEIAYSMQEHPAEFTAKSQLFKFVATAAARDVKDAIRTLKKEDDVRALNLGDGDADEPAIAGHENELVRREEADVYRAAIEGLTRQARRVHELRYTKGMSREEVAAALGLGKDAVDYHSKTIKKHLKEVLREYEEGRPPAGYVNPIRRAPKSPDSGEST